MTQFSYYRWRMEFGGLKGDQVKRLNELEKGNDRLRKAVSELTLEKLVLIDEPSHVELYFVSLIRRDLGVMIWLAVLQTKLF